MLEIATTSAKETQKIARMLAEELLRAPRRRGARVVALKGDLGVGKTTFAQGFAAALGVKENVLSPTFVLMKIYGLRPRIKGKSKKIKNKKKEFRHLIHIDCYRIQSPKDMSHLGLRDLFKDKDALILIEWADRIKKILPADTIRLKFEHGARQNQRRIVMSKMYADKNRQSNFL